MIVVFPMLTSSSVSSNILPGICKMLEKHILLYNMDTIINTVKKNADIERVGMSLRLKESNTVNEENGRGGKGGKGGETDEEGKKKAPKGGVTLSLPGGSGVKPKPKTDIGAPKIEQTLALEPTWVKIETRDGYSLLGVKVVPFPVSSDENIVKLMISDKSLSFWKRTIQRNYRPVIRAIFRASRFFGKFAGYKGGDLTGDPKKDIIFAMTSNKRNVLTLLDQADIEDENFLKDIGGIQKLFQLGWTSFAVADDTAAKVNFCMRQFKGTCSIIPYKMIYSALGGEQRKVYDDLEDIKQRSGAIFRAKTNIRKLFGEAMAHTKLNEFEPISESNVMTFAKSLKTSSKSIGAGIDAAVKKGDKESLNKALSKVPKMDINQVESFCAKFSSDFKAKHSVSQKVIKNSIKGMPDDVARAVSCVLSVGTHGMTGDPKKNNAKAVKTFVISARQGGVEVAWETLKKAKEAIEKAPDADPEEIKNITKKWIEAVISTVTLGGKVLKTLWEAAVETLPGDQGSKQKIKDLPGKGGKAIKWVAGVIGAFITILVTYPIAAVAVAAVVGLILIAWISRKA